MAEPEIETQRWAPEIYAFRHLLQLLRWSLNHFIHSVSSALFPKFAGSSDVLSSTFRAIFFANKLLLPPFFASGNFEIKVSIYIGPHTSYWQDPEVCFCAGESAKLLSHS